MQQICTPNLLPQVQENCAIRVHEGWSDFLDGHIWHTRGEKGVPFEYADIASGKSRSLSILQAMRISNGTSTTINNVPVQSARCDGRTMSVREERSFPSRGVPETGHETERQQPQKETVVGPQHGNHAGEWQDIRGHDQRDRKNEGHDVHVDPRERSGLRELGDRHSRTELESQRGAEAYCEFLCCSSGVSAPLQRTGFRISACLRVNDSAQGCEQLPRVQSNSESSSQGKSKSSSGAVQSGLGRGSVLVSNPWIGNYCNMQLPLLILLLIRGAWTSPVAVCIFCNFCIFHQASFPCDGDDSRRRKPRWADGTHSGLADIAKKRKDDYTSDNPDIWLQRAKKFGLDYEDPRDFRRTCF